MGNDVMAGSELTAVNMNNTVVRASVWYDVTGESWERSAELMLKKQGLLIIEAYACISLSVMMIQCEVVSHQF